jgi:hypothetical protein
MSGPDEPGQGSPVSPSRGSREGTPTRVLELDATRIGRLLHQLDERLRSRGVTASLYVVGGAAVLAATGLRRVTRDVDVTHLDPIVAEEARRLAHDEGLTADWLSSAAGAWAPPGHRGETAAAEPGLTVRYASIEELLAMKMLALRSRDAPDIVALAGQLGLNGAPPERFGALLHQVYPDDRALALLLGVGDDDLNREVLAVAEAVSRLTTATA